MNSEERASHILRSLQEAREEERRACAEICDRLAEKLEAKILAGDSKFLEGRNALLEAARLILERSIAKKRQTMPAGGLDASDHRDTKP